ncbi:hypothetical protein EYA84_09915, partial [Verrucosispora sp. SN26_14.1]
MSRTLTDFAHPSPSGSYRTTGRYVPHRDAATRPIGTARVSPAGYRATVTPPRAATGSARAKARRRG